MVMVIIVSGCLILTTVNLIILRRMACMTERLVKLCKIYYRPYVTVDGDVKGRQPVVKDD